LEKQDPKDKGLWDERYFKSGVYGPGESVLFQESAKGGLRTRWETEEGTKKAESLMAVQEAAKREHNAAEVQGWIETAICDAKSIPAALPGLSTSFFPRGGGS
jgi:hypothetical protein